MTNEEMKGLNVDSIVSLLNETCDPFECYNGNAINENNEETFEGLTTSCFWSGWDIAKAIEVGRFHSSDKYVSIVEDGHIIYTFSTAEELSEHIGADIIMDILNEWWHNLDSQIKSSLSMIALPLHRDRGDAMQDFEDITQAWWDGLEDLDKFGYYQDTIE